MKAIPQVGKHLNVIFFTPLRNLPKYQMKGVKCITFILELFAFRLKVWYTNPSTTGTLKISRKYDNSDHIYNNFIYFHGKQEYKKPEISLVSEV
jgi:hypothetical protein